MAERLYEQLAWGCKFERAGIDPDADAYFGARMILTDTLSATFVPDRVSRVGDPAAAEMLTDYLADIGLPALINSAVVMERIYPHKTEVFVLYEDDRVRVIGTPNGSYGYLYVTAWQHAWWEDDDDPVGDLADEAYERHVDLELTEGD